MPDPKAPTPPPQAHQSLQDFIGKAEPDAPVIPVTGLPGTEDKVRDFLISKGAQVAPAETPAPEVERTKVPVDPVFSEPNPEEQAVQTALIDLRSVAVTDEDKSLFMKALLCDTPVTLKVPMYDGKLVLTFRSRTMHEQRRVLDTLHLQQEDKSLPSNDPALVFTRLQQYFAAIMLRQINDAPFSDLDLVPGSTAKKDAKALHDVFTTKLEGMSHIRWLAILNGLRIFEEKCRQLSENCANEDFWKPRG